MNLSDVRTTRQAARLTSFWLAGLLRFCSCLLASAVAASDPARATGPCGAALPIAT